MSQNVAKQKDDYVDFLLEKAKGPESFMINKGIDTLLSLILTNHELDLAGITPAIYSPANFVEDLNKSYKAAFLLEGDKSYPPSGQYGEYHRNVIKASGCKYPAVDAPAYVRAVALLITLYDIAVEKGLLDPALGLKNFITYPYGA